MIKEEPNLRRGARNYHDQVFEHEINSLINATQSHYEAFVLSSCGSHWC